MSYDKSDSRIHQGRYLAAALSAALHGIQPEEKPADISWRELYEMSVHQKVEGMVFSVVKQKLKEEDPDLFALWNRQYRFGVYYVYLQLEECDRILSALTKKGIRTLPLKGRALNALYPENHYRQMADIDILVEESNRDAVDAVVQGLGYHPKERQSAEHHDAYVSASNVNLEMHYCIVPTWSEFCPYYENLWEKLQWDKDHPLVGEMCADDMYIYMMVHFANHIRRDGQTVRILTDLYTWNQKMGAQMDEAAVAKRLKEMNLLELRAQVEALSYAWLAAMPGRMPEIPEETKRLEWMLLASGEDEGFEVRMFNEWRKIRERLRGPVGENIADAFRFVFPPRKTMTLDYPFLTEKPYVLPFTWIHRWGRIVVILAKGYAGIRRRKREKTEKGERKG